MELFISFLAWIVLLVGIPVICLVIHSMQFNAWKDNFSKIGLKRHAKEYAFFMFLGILLIIGANIIKNWLKS